MQKDGFIVPLPEQNGYEWQWLRQSSESEIPLIPTATTDTTSWGYSPQTLEEGWLKLNPKAQEEGEIS